MLKSTITQTHLFQRLEQLQHLKQLNKLSTIRMMSRLILILTTTSTRNNNCNYSTNEQYSNNCITKDKLSIIHFNSTSVFTNFNTIREYLQNFAHPFSVRAISETWFNQENGIDFEIDDYDLCYVNRHSVHSVLINLSTVLDNVMECLTIEINNRKKITLL